MTMEERIRFLHRIASREEVEGNERTARLFRRMADEARPTDDIRLSDMVRRAGGERSE